jgi:hypothetical protein
MSINQDKKGLPTDDLGQEISKMKQLTAELIGIVAARTCEVFFDFERKVKTEDSSESHVVDLTLPSYEYRVDTPYGFSLTIPRKNSPSS